MVFNSLAKNHSNRWWSCRVTVLILHGMTPECIWYYYFIHHLRAACKKNTHNRDRKLAIALIW